VSPFLAEAEWLSPRAWPSPKASKVLSEMLALGFFPSWTTPDTTALTTAAAAVGISRFLIVLRISQPLF
jgi:hypothetical protein